MRKGIVFAVVALVVVGLIVHAGDKPATAGSEGQGAAAPKVDPVKVSAGALFDAYHDNEVAADGAYKGKPLEVTGRVASITTDIASRPVVSLATSNEFMPVSARDVDAGVAGKLRKGASVRMLCSGRGMVMGSPQLSDCVVAE